MAIEAMVARYPDLDDSELAEVLGWFGKEATAHEVAMVASNERLAAPYRRLRAEHLDRLSAKEKIAAALVGLLVLGGIAGLYVSV
ncbi:hypothetical protein [Pelagerythrobacter sp.]|uniref:hypothetical protein n=1 Tax=Pelagerythrobacter sp. TaxID=2800702 RepID=UPI0035AFF04E